MATLHPTPCRAALIILVTCTCCATGQAQTQALQLEPVLVTGRAPLAAGVAGWGDTPLSRLPLQASVFSAEQIKASGAQRLSDLIGFDAALGDAYNAEGYWDFLTIRGFVIDNRFNYRRDGLPINAETSIPLDNKARVEVLKGLGGMQAGTSAPGGIVNLTVKRPADASFSAAGIEWRERGSVSAAFDLSRRFGDADSLGLRLNVAGAKLDPQVRAATGERRLIALAGDWQVNSTTRIELEGETSHRSQPSVPGFSMLGNGVPDARGIDPRINLNNQTWSQPVVLDADTGSIRVTHRLDTDWELVAHGATQRLRSDDRVAFPFGVFDPLTFACDPCDRFASDGSFTLWEFVSDNERRRTDAFDVSVSGKLTTGALRHQVQAGLLRSLFRASFGQQVFDIAGTGNIAGTAQTPPSSGVTAANANRDEQSSEIHLRDALSLDDRSTLWLGLRRTSLHRSSIGTDASGATDYAQTLTAPFLAASSQLSLAHMLYASWGKGFESEVVPNRPIYRNGGQALPALESRQFEIGVKGTSEQGEWSLAGFDIVRPAFRDIGSCDVDDSCTRIIDGNARHRGVELTGAVSLGPWVLRGGTQWLRAGREGSQEVGLNGLWPTNVPALTLKGQLVYAVSEIPGLELQTGFVRESSRQVLPDNSASIPGYTRLDAALRHEAKIGPATWTWRAGVDNFGNARAWKESPYQFNHVYLFPLAPRTLRLSVQAEL
ncbi:MAG: TonB-dependent receptor [Burkholderiales bacterium]|jgi:iron complex outermembrane receptor protein|nr:TonB-dependent receptor [Burkholderiales bacterium]